MVGHGVVSRLMPDTRSAQTKVASAFVAQLRAAMPSVEIIYEDSRSMERGKDDRLHIRSLSTEFARGPSAAETMCMATFAVDILTKTGGPAVRQDRNEEWAAQVLDALHADPQLGGYAVDTEEKSQVTEDDPTLDVSVLVLTVEVTYLRPDRNARTVIGPSGPL